LRASRTVAGGVQGGVVRGTREYVGCRPHRPGNQHRLPGVAQVRRELLVSRRKGTGGALAVNAECSAASVDLVVLEPSHVVRDVVDEVEVAVRGVPENPSRGVTEYLP